jgi:hypothetical protein
MECLIHHEEPEGHEEAESKVVFFMAFMPFMVKFPPVQPRKALASGLALDLREPNAVRNRFFDFS